MKPSSAASEERKKMLAVAAFVVIASALVYFEYFYTSTPTTPAPAEVATAPAASTGSSPAAAVNPTSAAKSAKTVGTTSAALDPTLHMEAMLVSESVEYAGSGRNIFSPNSAPPVVIQKPIAPARIQATLAPPAPVMAQGPPPPPPIDLKFFGVETSNGKRMAFLLHGDIVYVASAGDVVLRRYRVISIDAKTIDVEDMQSNNKQTLPLLAN
jgi:hypothetical protein